MGRGCAWSDQWQHTEEEEAEAPSAIKMGHHRSPSEAIEGEVMKINTGIITVFKKLGLRMARLSCRYSNDSNILIKYNPVFFSFCAFQYMKGK